MGDIFKLGFSPPTSSVVDFDWLLGGVEGETVETFL